MTFLRASSIGLLAFTGACAVQPDASTEVVEQELPAWCDDDWGCGSNSSEVDNYGMHDLVGLIGGVNAGGFRTMEMFHQTCDSGPPACVRTDMAKVWTERSVLKAETVGGGMWGGPIAGLRFKLQHISSGAKYEIKVEGMGRAGFWAAITGSEITVTYRLSWDVEFVPGQKRTWENVCVNPPPDGSPDSMGMDGFHSVLFEQDIIDATKKVVVGQASPKDRLFNIGCAGHALAKLHLMGKTTSAATWGFTASNDERTASLKMITGDVCGTGFAFTVAGQDLVWTDKPNYNVYPGAPGKKEAEWGPKGATCLNEPRVQANPTAAGIAAFPLVTSGPEGMLQEIKNQCGFVPKKCADVDPFNLNGHHIVSSNP